MRVTKIIQSPVIYADGKWNVFCQVYMGNSYIYGAIICDTMEEAFAIRVGQILDVEKVKFSRRISL
ncbi:MAG: hypothetical protein U0M06_02670 [Clostridia bacterium]|nr:hypothetical protein [Clostridia bacterium]